MDIKQPPLSVLIKLGSLLIHYQEWVSSNGHSFDKMSIDTLEQDPEIIEWLAKMDELALLPKRRK